MEKRSKPKGEDRDSKDLLTDLIRTGAQQLSAQALQVEVAELLATYAEQRDEQGPARVVRNGHQPARAIQTGIGPLTVQVPKMRSRQGKPVTFHSALFPPYVRKTASLEATLPWLYLKGISTGEMQPALEVLVGPEAKGLSASTVSRLKQIWREDYASWRQRRLDADNWVYIWVDGIYSGLRADCVNLQESDDPRDLSVTACPQTRPLGRRILAGLGITLPRLASAPIGRWWNAMSNGKVIPKKMSNN